MRILLLGLVGICFGILPEKALAEDCAVSATKEATAECLRLCPTACKEPLNWAHDQFSVEECDAGCMSFCEISMTDEITSETPWIKAETIRDRDQRKAKCEDKPIDGPTPWRSVDPVASSSTP